SRATPPPARTSSTASSSSTPRARTSSPASAPPSPSTRCPAGTRRSTRSSCDMVKEKLITEKQALLRIPAGDLTQLLLPSFDPTAKKVADVLTRGLPASPGAAVGKPAFTAEEAVTRARAGEKVILVRKETSPEDVDGMHSAAGILT